MGNIPHSPQKKALQISVAPFLIFVSQKISQKYPKDCNSTARNSKGLQDALINIYKNISGQRKRISGHFFLSSINNYLDFLKGIGKFGV